MIRSLYPPFFGIFFSFAYFFSFVSFLTKPDVWLSSGYHSVIIHLSSSYCPVIVWLSSGYRPVIVQLLSCYRPVIFRKSSCYCPAIVRLLSGYRPVIFRLPIFRLCTSPSNSLISLSYSMPAFSANSFRLFNKVWTPCNLAYVKIKYKYFFS